MSLTEKKQEYVNPTIICFKNVYCSLQQSVFESKQLKRRKTTSLFSPRPQVS